MVKFVLEQSNFNEGLPTLVLALYRALATGCSDIVSILLNVPGLKIEDIKMCQLYDSKAGNDVYRLLRTDRGLQRRMKRYFDEIEEEERARVCWFDEYAGLRDTTTTRGRGGILPDDF